MSTRIDVFPPGAQAVGAISHPAVTLDAAVSKVRLSFQRNSWPVMASAQLSAVRGQSWISYDGGTTWVLLAGFTAPGGSTSAAESSVITQVKPEMGFPRQIRMTGNIMAAINTAIYFTVE